MTSIAPRPNYKPGDFEFDFDVTNIFYVRSALKNGNETSEVKKSLYRQVVYWQCEAENACRDTGLRNAYNHLQARYDAALETITSMARTIEKLTGVATDTDAVRGES